MLLTPGEYGPDTIRPVRELNESFNSGQRAVLESVAKGAPLGELLEHIVRFIESQSKGMLCSIVLIDDQQRVYHVAAPSLPAEYVRAIDGSPIGPEAGSCGAAAYLGRCIVVRDIATHPNWVHYRHLALPYGLRACWSTPIFSPEGAVLGTFAMYYREKREPNEQEAYWVQVAVQLASIAIVRDRADETLRRSEARAQQLAQLYAVSSGVNEAIVRVRDPQALYEFACRIAVEHGLAELAWVGLCDETRSSLRPVARYGTHAEYVDAIELDLSDERMNKGPAGRAILTGVPTVATDIANDPTFFWKGAALNRGLNSCAVFPLRIGRRVIGAFALYSDRTNYFRVEEMKVLTDLAADISFAVESAENERERLRMEAAVRESEKLRSLMISSVADAIFYLAVESEDKYRFLAVNHAFLARSGVKESDVVGHLLDERLDEGSRHRTLERYSQAISQRKSITWEEQSCHYLADMKYGDVTITPIFDAAGRCTHVVGTIHDITARKQAEDERSRLESQLHQSQHLQSLGTLAGGIAHDFNNILVAISGNADLALLESAGNQAAQEHLVEIQKASRRASELVAQILTFSRREPPTREVIDVRAVVKEALGLLRATLPANIEIKPRFAIDTPAVSANSTQLHQIVMNLGTNSAHALRERGGSIEVSLDGYLADADAASRVADLAEGHYARLRVSDNGCGMDPETLQRAFDPFYTTRPAGEGTGLGLPVVHGIVKSHHGAIEVQSQQGRGTTFSIYLPAASAQGTGARSLPVTSTSGQGECILYVDDEEPLVFLASRALKRMGYRVAGHTDAAAALEDFRAHPEAFDLVVTDLSMPGMSGPQLTAELRAIRPDVPVIMTSGYIRPEDIEAAERLRVNQLVYKPNTIEELGQLLSAQIETLRAQRSGGGQS